jgi:hypothetical protein
LKKFRTYLIGIKFRVVTDCNALRTTFTKKNILPRVGRWWLTLQEFNFEVVYQSDAKMLHVDASTKFVIMKAVPNTKTTHLEKILKKRIIKIFGVPKRLVTDRETCFTSGRFKQTCKRVGTKLILNATATPRANGQVERYNRTLLASIAATFSDEETWDYEISKVAWGLNTTANKATGESPFKLVFGSVPRIIHDAFLANKVDTDQYNKDVNKTKSEVEERLQFAGQCAKSRHDKKRCVPKTFHEGELVVVRFAQRR